MVGYSVPFADFPENLSRLPDEFDMFHSLCENRSEISEGVSFVGSSGDEAYFFVLKGAECGDETLGGGGFGIVDKSDTVLRGYQF